MRIAIDAMGGDYAPAEIVKGTLQFTRKHPEHIVKLVGDKTAIRKFLPKCYDTQHLIIHTPDWIRMDEKVASVRSRREASMVVAAKEVRDNRADGVVLLGNTAASMAVGSLFIGRIKSVEKPPIATVWPSINGGNTVLLDSGAITDCEAFHLLQFARLGNALAKHTLGIEQPRVALLSIGEEPGKGNKLVQNAARELKQCKRICYVGLVEGRDLPFGKADVIVTDGFTGNVALKAAEGVGAYAKAKIRRNLWKPKTWAALPFLFDLKRGLDCDEYGGAPLLGIDGVCIIGHGNSKKRAVEAALGMAVKTFESGVIDAIKKEFEETE